MKDVNEAENLWDKNLLRKFRFRSCPHQMKDLEKVNDFLVRDLKVIPLIIIFLSSSQEQSQIHSACVVQSSLKILTECIRIVGTIWDWGWVIGCSVYWNAAWFYLTSITDWSLFKVIWLLFSTQKHQNSWNLITSTVLLIIFTEGEGG